MTARLEKGGPGLWPGSNPRGWTKGTRVFDAPKRIGGRVVPPAVLGFQPRTTISCASQTRLSVVSLQGTSGKG